MKKKERERKHERTKERVEKGKEWREKNIRERKNTKNIKTGRGMEIYLKITLSLIFTTGSI